MTRAIKLFTTIIILFPLFCFSQKQGYIWYFADSCGLDFSSGTPVVLTDGNIDIVLSYGTEGTATISDSSGSLLFYANAARAWNRNHQVMPNGNGLLGGVSSTQGAFIIPKPGSLRLFYLFTTDQFQNQLANGLRYSVIDMCLDGGLGDVIPGQKNILLLDTAGEKMAGTNHANGTDYWLVNHKFLSDAFYAYHISSGGIIDTVVSHIGSVHHDSLQPSNFGPALGQMKISPDGSKIALARGNLATPFAELFDFDNSTGIVSNLVTLPPEWQAYGVSFSPDNSKLYLSTLGSHEIIQYDVSSGNVAAIIASRTIIFSASSWPLAGLQLGPDGKIYIAGSNYLDVINNPNVAGPGCNYSHNAIDLGHFAWYGITNFIDSYNYHNGLVGECPPTSVDESESTCLKIPKVFTPNDGALNDVFNPACISNVTSFDCKIFNSLGQKVYATSDTRINWNGKECPPGLYSIVINYTDLAEKKYQIAAPVFLLQ